MSESVGTLTAYTGRMGEDRPAELWDDALRAAQDSARRLRQAEVTPGALAAYIPAGKRLGILPRPATMRPLGDVWRLGVLLLDTDGRLYASGRATRAEPRGRAGYQSQSREERRDLAAAALRGGYPSGTPVNFDAIPLTLEWALRAAGSDATCPVGFTDDALRVRWNRGASLQGAPTLAQYLDERVRLLVDPPLGST